MRYRFALLFAAVATLTLLASSPPALASWPGRNAAIAFTTDDGIATMSENGLRREVLSEPGDDNAKWSRDGTMIAFQRENEVWVMNGDGSEQRMVTTGLRPTWTSDNNLLVSINGEILKVNLFGQTLANYTNTPNVTESEGVMSPDGLLIAFSSDEDPNGDPQNPTPGTTSNLWMVDPLDLTNKSLVWQQDNGTYEGQLDWAPDSSRIAFIDDGNIWTTPPDSNNQTAITNDAERQQHPTWSPDGKLIAYDQDIGAMDPRIFTIDVDTRQTQQLSIGGPDDSAPHWQPWLTENGRLWYLTGFGFDRGDGIASSEPDGSHRRDIGPEIGPAGGFGFLTATSLAWSPDGTKLAISQGDGLVPEQFNTGVASPTLELVGFTEGNFPSWFPDSRRVVTSDEGDLWVRDTAALNPSAAINITNTANNVEEADSAISTDGRWIVFSSNESPGSDPQNPTTIQTRNMWLMNSEGIPADRTPILQSATYQGFPSWSPDGTRVAYGDNGDIWTVDPFNPIDRVNLTNDALFQSHPAWSPDGTRIAFAQRSGIISNDSQVWTMNTAGQQRSRVTQDTSITEGAPEWHPLWAPGSDSWYVWGDSTCLGSPGIESVLATLFVLAGLNPMRRPGCPIIGELGLTSTNVTTQWGNLDCESGVDGADVLAGIAYTIELEIPVFQEPQGGPIEDPCPPLDTYIEWIPLD